MKIRTLIHAGLIGFALGLSAAPARAESLRGDIESIVKDYLAAHPEDVERIVRNYLTKNPDVLRDALVEMIKNRGSSATAARPAPAAALPDRAAAIEGLAKELFESPHQAVVGNPKGKTTLVEFFDYNCPYCKRALGDMETAIKDDPDLRVVLKELPVLGVGSLEAARVAVAVRMADPTGRKYLEFHRRLMSGGRVDKASAMAAAVDLGFDAAKLEKDMMSDEANQTLEESGRLAQALGINGTPGYVVGTTIIPGAIGAARLKETIARARAEAPKPRG